MTARPARRGRCATASHPRGAADAGSLPLALLFILVATSLTALMSPLATIQIAQARQENQRSHALHAALAGLEVAVNSIRNASDGSGNGVLAGLPRCNGAISGTLGDTGYTVNVHYLAVDPRGQSPAWAAANAVCTSGTPAATPAYALLVSTGSELGNAAPVAQRTIRATYTFRSSSALPAGGRIYAFRTTPTPDYTPAPFTWGFYSRVKPAPSIWDLCFDAGSSANVGTAITMQSCAANKASQLFAYSRDLTIVLVGSQTAARPEGLCLDAGSPHVRQSLLRLQKCGNGAPLTHQQWAFNSNANFEGTSDAISGDGFCFNVKSPNNPGSGVWLGRASNNECLENYDDTQTFIPEATVGAGAANPPNTTGQLVSFGQFGRCLDIPGGETVRGYLISWPCKQAFDGAVAWNQKWTKTASVTPCPEATPCVKGVLSVTAPAGEPSPAGKYCLQSPASAALGLYAYAKVSCTAGTAAASMIWTIYGDTGDPLTRYHIVDHKGRCLEPSDTDLFQNAPPISNIVLNACASDTFQMWNAPPDAMDPTGLKDFSEQ